MEAWAWLTAYLVAFALLQLALYRYFRGRNSASERSRRQHGDHTGAGTETRTEAVESGLEAARDATTGADDASGSVRCKHCGAPNEGHPTFTYCRRCTQPLQ